MCPPVKLLSKESIRQHPMVLVLFALQNYQCSHGGIHCDRNSNSRNLLQPPTKINLPININHKSMAFVVMGRTDIFCLWQKSEGTDFPFRNISIFNGEMFLLLSLAPQPSLGLGLLHKIRLNFLEASQHFSFLQDRVVSPTPNIHPGGPGLCIYIHQRQGGYPF
jgi:hypothetical protein